MVPASEGKLGDTALWLHLCCLGWTEGLTLRKGAKVSVGERVSREGSLTGRLSHHLGGPPEVDWKLPLRHLNTRCGRPGALTPTPPPRGLLTYLESGPRSLGGPPTPKFWGGQRDTGILFQCKQRAALSGITV